MYVHTSLHTHYSPPPPPSPLSLSRYSSSSLSSLFSCLSIFSFTCLILSQSRCRRFPSSHILRLAFKTLWVASILFLSRATLNPQSSVDTRASVPACNASWSFFLLPFHPAFDIYLHALFANRWCERWQPSTAHLYSVIEATYSTIRQHLKSRIVVLRGYDLRISLHANAIRAVSALFGLRTYSLTRHWIFWTIDLDLESSLWSSCWKTRSGVFSSSLFFFGAVAPLHQPADTREDQIQVL